uniref:THAP domain-containing protein 1 n=1 Tax=Schizaphis graminum TaxID=13262 RepID=A0A2S2NPK9_SCHGA
MVQKCYSCGSARTDNIKLHGFPKDINLRQKWVSSLQKDVPIKITQYTRLCSQHFTKDDYYQSSFGNDILKPDAVPSKFFSSRKSLFTEIHVCKNSNNKQTSISIETLPDKLIYPMVSDNLQDLILDEEVVVNENENDSGDSIDIDSDDTEITAMQSNENIDIKNIHLTNNKRKLFRYAGDFIEDDLETPRKRKMFWITYQQMIKNKNDKIRLLQQKNRRLKTKINNLNSIIDDYKCKTN